MKVDTGKIITVLLENIKEIEKQKGKTLIIIDKHFNLSMVNESYYNFVFRELNNNKVRISFFDVEDNVITEIITITESKEQEIIINNNIIYNLKHENINIYEDIIHIEYKIIEKINILN